MKKAKTDTRLRYAHLRLRIYGHRVPSQSATPRRSPPFANRSPSFVGSFTSSSFSFGDIPTMMRRSTGMISGDMLRAVGRAVGAGAGRVRGPLSAARAGSSVPVLRVSSSGATSPHSSSAPTFDSAARKGAVSDSRDALFDGEEWERVGGEEHAWDEGVVVDDGVGTLERYVFGTAPSREEADDAISTLQQVLLPTVISQVTDDGSQVSDNGSSPYLAEDVIDDITTPGAMHRGYSSESSVECQSDWIEPAIQLYESNFLKSRGEERVFNALQLYQRNATVQRMVVSLSSDAAVWDAVMNNEVVQELRRSFHEDGSASSEIGNSDEHADTKTSFLGRILGTAKSKIMEFIDQISKLAHQIFHTEKELNKKNTAFDDAVKSSFMISIIVFMIVIVTRINKP